MTGHLGERLSALLDGEMSAADRAEAQAHLRECAACARELEELASVDALARDLAVEAPAGYFDELPDRVRARVRARRRPRIAPLAVWAAAAAAVVMVAVVAPLTLRRAPSTAPAASPVAPAPMADARDAPAATAATAAPTDGRRASSLPAFDAGEVPARLRERDASRDAPPAADLARRDKLSARVAVPAPAAEPPPAALPPAAPAPQRRAEGSVAQTKAEEKANQAFSDEAADAVVPMAEMRKESEAAAAPRAGQLAGAGYARPASPRQKGDGRYELLVARRPTTAADARALAKAWEAFARDLPADRRADEARVRAIESLVMAWRLGGEPGDLASARAAGEAYVEAERAPQGGRVRALLETLPPTP